MNSIKTNARFAGALYLLAGIPTAISLEYIPSHLFVTGDVTATTKNILASEQLLRLGIVSGLVGWTAYIWVALVLYQLFKSVSRNQAILVVLLTLVGTPIALLNELNQFALLLLLHNSAGFTTDQVNTLVSFFLNLHTAGIHIAEIFWGLWLFPLGYLTLKSGFLPGVLGIFDMITGLGYLLDVATFFLFPDLNTTVIQVLFFGELGLPLWLLIRGINAAQWEKRVLGTAPRASIGAEQA